MKRFEGKVVLITGSSRGIGKACALEFAKEGAKIIIDFHISDIEPDADKNAALAVNEIKKMGSEAIAIKCDVSKEDEVKSMFDEAVKNFGTIDILVNNAGIVYDFPIEEKTTEQWKRTFEVDLLGAFICCKEAVSHMQVGSSIINIASTNGINAICPDSMDYNAVKAGLINLTANLAKKFAPKIRINAIAPGWVDTKMNAGLPKEYVDQETQKTWLKRFANSSEIAKPVLFLASEDASFITGTTLIVDGGYK